MNATFIVAPSSTKNKSKSRNSEMASGKKGNTWHIGMEVHQGSDDVDGLVHTVKFTPANVHDIVMTDELRRLTDKIGYGDADYLGPISGRVPTRTWNTPWRRTTAKEKRCPLKKSNAKRS